MSSPRTNEFLVISVYCYRLSEHRWGGVSACCTRTLNTARILCSRELLTVTLLFKHQVFFCSINPFVFQFQGLILSQFCYTQMFKNSFLLYTLLLHACDLTFLSLMPFAPTCCGTTNRITYLSGAASAAHHRKWHKNADCNGSRSAVRRFHSTGPAELLHKRPESQRLTQATHAAATSSCCRN